MRMEQIVALLIQERDRLERAIQALGGGEKRRGRPPKTGPAIEGLAAVGSQIEPKKKRHVSAAARRKMAVAQKKRWAALKASK